MKKYTTLPLYYIGGLFAVLLIALNIYLVIIQLSAKKNDALQTSPEQVQTNSTTNDTSAETNPTTSKAVLTSPIRTEKHKTPKELPAIPTLKQEQLALELNKLILKQSALTALKNAASQAKALSNQSTATNFIQTAKASNNAGSCSFEIRLFELRTENLRATAMNTYSSLSSYLDEIDSTVNRAQEYYDLLISNSPVNIGILEEFIASSQDTQFKNSSQIPGIVDEYNLAIDRASEALNQLHDCLGNY